MKIHLNQTELKTLEHLLVKDVVMYSDLLKELEAHFASKELKKPIVSDKDLIKVTHQYNLSYEILGKVQTALAKGGRKLYVDRQAYKRGQNEKTIS